MPRISNEQAEQYQNNLNGEWFQLKNNMDVARVQFMFDNNDELEVYACHKVKVGEKERYVNCFRSYDEPIDKCPFCEAGIPVKAVRFIIMFQHDDNKVKIWERGKEFVSKVQGLMNRYSPLSQYVFEIERHGVAGDKKTKYEIFPMDRAEPVNLNEFEYPELLGGLILDKDEEEMRVYLDTSDFPDTGDDQNYSRSQPQQQSLPSRRAPVSRSNPPEQAPISRRAASSDSTPPQSGPSRRRAASAPASSSPSRGTRSAPRGNAEGEERF